MEQSLASINQAPTPGPVSQIKQPKDSETVALSETLVPEEFKYVDFRNFSYRYRSSNRRRINVTLRAGAYEYDFKTDRGWFNLSDVYYTDLTGDGSPEAIVLLTHVSCGVSCDGGASLFYVYVANVNNLRRIWQYETGSLAYGCGLKLFSVKNRKVTMELFGRCSNPAEEYPGSKKYYVEDTTLVAFRFNGRRFLQERKTFISVAERYVGNYKPEISIN
jgi:hypothetical protein